MKKKKVVTLNEQDFLSLLKNVIDKIKNFSTGDDEKIKSNVNSIKKTSNFSQAVDKIIDEFEGGYYHPDMLKDGRVKDSRYGGSGETMFGMDRLTGKQESTSAGKEFWDIIDKENARSKWPHNHMLKNNPTLAGKLRGLVVQIMEPLFNQFMEKYLTPEAREIVKNNPKLYFNFAYATFNGPGWFNKFAKIINNEVSKGNKDPESLLNIDIINRKNADSSLISQGAKKLDKITDTIV
jgi:hypothetical protein